MTAFERAAIFTMIEMMESQLRGLKGLIAASANAEMPAASTHKVTNTMASEGELSDEDEDRLEREIKAGQAAEIAKLSARAQDTYLGELSRAVGGGDLNG
jgi:hypothetical protein